jgi:hypothetical protein
MCGANNPRWFNIFNRLLFGVAICGLLAKRANSQPPSDSPESPVRTFELQIADNPTDSQFEDWISGQIGTGSQLSSLPYLTESSVALNDPIHFAYESAFDPMLAEDAAEPVIDSYPIIETALESETLQASHDVDLGLEGDRTFQRPTTLLGRLWQDERHFYSPKSLAMIGGGLGVGAIFANTSWDDGLQRHIHSSLHHANTDEWLESLHANKEFGDGRVTIPVFAGAWAVGHLLPEMPFSKPVGTWGERSIRGFVVGAPAVVLLQMATGASRPNETGHTSEWEPFQDNNGVSGHAFMGALPFITAAKMTESRGLKAVFYAGSALAPLSRTADGAHYPSQVALGWWMAYVAATAVHATDRPGSNWSLYPTATPNSSGMAFEYRY